MKHFERKTVTSFEEAGEIIRNAEGRATAMAGGSDLLGTLKDNLLPEYPETVVNLKSISGADDIVKNENSVVLGAMTKLSAIAQSEEVALVNTALKEAAYSVASPLIRNIGTIGGNICQDVRCWYYRYPDSVGGALHCKRKGGRTCYAINGENQYHSVFGGMSCGGSACTKSCPAGTDIPGYMAKLREGDWDGAAQIILKYNPMPMMTSRICPHTCQNDCNQNVYGESVNVHAVERALGDYILNNANVYYQVPEKETGKSVAVIGAGPGGLSAAYYLRKEGHQVVVYDRMEKAGGVLRYGIPHYRLPKTILDNYIAALENMGVIFKMNTEVGRDISVEEIKKQADSVYFGTGAWKQPILGLEGENLTEFGLDFLVEVNTYLKKSIGGEVLVCGGGNVAMDVALTAVRLGAKKVKLVCLEQEKDMPASAEEVARAKEEGVELYCGWGLGKVVTDDNGIVRGLEAKRCISVFDENHRFAPTYNESDRQIVEAETIILATGQRVDISFLGEELAQQIKSERGLIETDPETGKTGKSGMYAGGDAVTGPNVAIRAIAAGRVAASGMNRELGTPGKGMTQKEGFLHFDVKGIETVSANKQAELLVDQRSLTEEDTSGLDTETVIAEAGRCMNCGCYAVNPSDITPVLVMMDADIVTTTRTLKATELFTSKLTVQNVLEPGELVKEISVPKSRGVSHYDKKRVRNAIDFAIVSLASDLDVEDGVIRNAKLVYGGVAPVPYEMKDVEELLTGQKLTAELIEEAKTLAVKDATPMAKNEYKLYMIKDLMDTALSRMAEKN